jgi:hypothetical protein
MLNFDESTWIFDWLIIVEKFEIQVKKYQATNRRIKGADFSSKHFTPFILMSIKALVVLSDRAGLFSLFSLS